MPGRKLKIVTNHYYHIYNRGVAKLPTFTDMYEYKRFINLIDYYRFINTPLKYSSFIKLPIHARRMVFQNLLLTNKLQVEIVSFILMPNHFHFTLKQITTGGISKFIANVTNSYTKYVNTKKDRVGPLFQGKFKAVIVNTTEQLIHLSRYQHLNIYTSQLVTSFDKLLTYPYSSLPDYIRIEKVHDFISTDIIHSHFKSKSAYKKFVLDHADYQKKLGRIKKLTLEKPAKLVPTHLRGGWTRN